MRADEGNLAEGRRPGVWARGRAALRRVMPRVALVALGMFVLWALLSGTPLSETAPDNVLDVLTFAVVCFTILYFAARAALWIKRKLLWRVRRRLIITYLFVGLTPLVLLGILGALAWAILSGQAMTRVVQVEINATERGARAAAAALAADLLRQPAGTTTQGTQQWLDQRAALLRASLPGARVAVWRGGSWGGTSAPAASASGGEALGALGQGRAAEVVSAPEESAEVKPVGFGELPADGAPLPEWLAGQAEWSGFAFTAPPEDSNVTFGAPSIRALVRREEGGRAVALLVSVPVTRALVQRMRESTGIGLRPYFVGSRTMSVDVKTDGDGLEFNSRRLEEGERPRGLDLQAIDDAQLGSRDQFGEPLPKGAPYIVLLPATNWADGESDTRLSFMFEYSWAEARRQLLDSSAVGEVLKRLLLGVAIAFLALEVLALMGAAWMTRAVTGTVHKLYRATESVKRGDFSHRIRARSHDQLGELAGAFDEMSANIEALLKERVERERLEREVEIAHEVQAQLFPRSVPVLGSAEIAGECRAARGVAGDHYDYIEIEPGLLAFALGDVSGKGLSAALVMSNLQAALRAQVAIIAERRRLAAMLTAAAASSASPASSPPVVVAAPDSLGACGVVGADADCAVENMVATINRQLSSSTESNRFATLFLAVYDDRTRNLRYTNAGHNAPVLVRADGTVERLVTGGTIVGVFDFATYEEARVQLAPGDLLVVFSDGISEAQNATGEEYGEERLAQFAAARRGLSADELRRAIFDEVDRWSGQQERGDDQTLVILKTMTSGE